MAFKRKKSQEVTGEQAPAPAKPRAKTKAAKIAIQKGGKQKQFVLLVGDDGAILVFMEGSKVVRRLFALTPQPSNTEAMVELLQSNPKVPITLLIDTIDQQFVRQSFPPVSSLSVNGLVKRRIDRDFNPEDLSGFLPLGRDKTGRKEWNFLLISLAKTPTLNDWTGLISELPNQLKGIYLVPVEGTLYLPIIWQTQEISTTNQWQLLLTHNKVSGFRQIVTNGGKLAFTRVTQATDDAIPAVIAGNIEQEIINTIEYLRRLGLQEHDGLDILVVASAEVNESLNLQRFNIGSHLALTPLEVANSLGLEQAALSADRFGDVVLASAFLRTKKRLLKFSTAYALLLDKLYGIRKAINVGACLLVLALIGLSAQNVLSSFENISLASTSEQKRKAMKGDLDSALAKVSGLNKNLALKSAVVSTYDALIKEDLKPASFIKALIPHLSAEQRVLSIDWERVGAILNTGTTAQTSPLSDKDGPLRIKVEFEFKGAYPDLDALSKSVDAFIATLTEKMPQYTIAHEPFAWQKESGRGLEISFDQQKNLGVQAGNERITLTFNGPKKLPATNANPNAAPPTPGAP